MSGVAQHTVQALRRDVEAKFSRLPLAFFDTRTHGEIMSRVVNDLDNISSTLQQNVTQLISSALSVSKRMPPLITTRPSFSRAFAMSSGDAVVMSNFDASPILPVVAHPKSALAMPKAIAMQQTAFLK